MGVERKEKILCVSNTFRATKRVVSPGGWQLFALLPVVLLGAAPGARTQTLTRGPYLQSLLVDSVKVLWVTDLESRGKVRFSDESGLEREIEEAAPRTRHVVLLQELSPWTVYSYEVLDGDEILASGEALRFRTPPLPGTGSFRAVVIGDSGDLSVNGENFQHGVTARVESFEPDVFIHTGDYVYTGTIDEVFFGEYRNLLVRTGVYPARGNHDTIFPLEWLEYFSPPTLPLDVPGCRLPAAVCDEDPPAPPPSPAGRTLAYYSFDWGPAHFAVIDSGVEFYPCSPQLKWLCADLTAAKERMMPWVAIVLHEPPYTAGLNGPSRLDRFPRYTGTYELLPPIVDQFAVDLVVAGHDHNYQRSWPLRGGRVVDAWQDPVFESPQGAVYIVTGGGGTRLYAERAEAIQRPLFKVFQAKHHAVAIDFTELSLSLRALTPGGEVLDEFTIRKDASPRSPGFLRGDTNYDGHVDIGDAAAILGALFLGAKTECAAAFAIVADTNGSHALDIADAVYLLTYLFLGGPPPDEPFARCDPLEGVDGSDCFAASCKR
jgi:hypothetical protein